MVSDRTVLAHESDFDLGGLTVRPSLSEVAADGVSHHVEPRVMQVLVALVQAKGEVLTRDDLIACCWDGVVVGDDAVSRVISKLRRLAGHRAAGFSIETLPRIGYRLTLAEAEPEAVSEPGPAPLSASQISRLRGRVSLRRFARRWGFAAPIALGSLAALLVIARVARPVRPAAQISTTTS